MNTFSIESWYKAEGAESSVPAGIIHFHVSKRTHRLLEKAEERLSERATEREMDIPAEMESLRLETPQEYEEIDDCQFHVYLSPRDGRGHFFLKGHSKPDGGLFYSNAIMVDQLG
ncbi:hypothetical protein [Marinobacterium jannaschii]|uniref:hypothetical protein n=1 Tax=Marinobacterium jannaschii TaxID=64970 RepID=UPI00048815F9|nr:hypothetical protein [Marinobacterium jannaschii]